MNKDKLEVGDLVTYKAEASQTVAWGIGLVTGTGYGYHQRRWKVYWFKHGGTADSNVWWYEYHLRKLSPTQEKEKSKEA